MVRLKTSKGLKYFQSEMKFVPGSILSVHKGRETAESSKVLFNVQSHHFSGKKKVFPIEGNYKHQNQAKEVSRAVL